MTLVFQTQGQVLRKMQTRFLQKPVVNAVTGKASVEDALKNYTRADEGYRRR